jgi:hypothetical protein
VGGAAPVPAAAASAWLLFFPPAFDVFDGDDFILQEQGVFTRIRSGGYPTAFGWQCARIYYGGGARWSGSISRFKWRLAAAHLGENPKGFGLHL